MNNPTASSLHSKSKKTSEGMDAKKNEAAMTATGLPPRPYTEYNIFFRIERARLLQSAGMIDDEIVGSLDPTHRDPLEFPRPAGYESVSLPPYWYSRSRSASTKKRRKHRKREWGMDLKILGKTVSASWRDAPAAIVEYCKRLANAEMTDHRAKVERITKKRRLIDADTKAPSNNELGNLSKSPGIIPDGTLHLKDVAVDGGRASMTHKARPNNEQAIGPVTLVNASTDLREASSNGQVNECTTNETTAKLLHHWQLQHAYMHAQLSLGNNSPNATAPMTLSFQNNGPFASFAPASCSLGKFVPPAMDERNLAPPHRVTALPAMFAPSQPLGLPQRDPREGTGVCPDFIQAFPDIQAFPGGPSVVKKRKLAQTLLSATSKFTASSAFDSENDNDDAGAAFFEVPLEKFSHDGDSRFAPHVLWTKEDLDWLLDILDLPAKPDGKNVSLSIERMAAAATR